MKHILLGFVVLLCGLSAKAQVIKFQSAGAGGTTPSKATDGSLIHYGVVGSPVSQGSGNNNQAGFFFATIDYRPATQASGITVTAYTVNSISLSWTNGNGARRMVVARAGSAVNANPVDGTSYTAHATLGSGSQIGTGNYVVFDSGTGNSVTVSGLSPGEVYHFRIFEYNGKYGANDVNVVYQLGTSTNNPISHTTRSPEPTAQPTGLNFSTITATAMNASFTAATGSPTGYIVLRRQGAAPTGVPADGTVYTAGNTLGDGTVVHSGSGTTFNNTGLTAGTVYHYAVYAYNGSGLSINYLTSNPLREEKITVPSIPPQPTDSDVNIGTFRIHWTAMPGAEGYRLQVSRNAAFTNMVSGYNPKEIIGGSQTQHLVENLSTSTYYYRVEAVNSSGGSGYSPHRDVFVSGVPGGNDLAIAYTDTGRPTTFSQNISVTVTGGSGEKEIMVYWRGIRDAEFTTKTMSQVGTSNTYQTSIDSNIPDELGIEYFVQAADNTATVRTLNAQESSLNDYLYKPVPSNTSIPNLPVGGKVSDYRIISIPYALNLNNSAIVFSTLGAYDKANWRLLNWNGSAYVDNPGTIAVGQGYWFNARQSYTITLGEGTVSKNNQSTPFNLLLKQGWNMVATPYPFTIPWDDVLEYNGNPAVGDYYVFNGTSYAVTHNLEPWKGGFVYADAATTLTIPVVFPTSGGRKGFAEEFNALPGEGNWLLPITVKQGALENTLPAFGMHEDAVEDKDRFDAISLPRFIEYLDLTVTHPESFSPSFMRDVVPPQQRYVWPFTLDATGEEPITLQWDNESIRQSKAQLLLYDVQAGRLIDMRAHGTYTVSDANNRQLQFIFSTDELHTGNSELSKAYPNPFTGEVNLPAYLHLGTGEATVRVSIINPAGITVYHEAFTTASRGLIRPVWNGADQSGNPVMPGMYIYKLTFTSGHQSYVSQGKILKQ